MENISEKKKRGRPQKPDTYEVLESGKGFERMSEGKRSLRQHYNSGYMVKAFGLFYKKTEYSFLADSKTQKMKIVILTELGRILVRYGEESAYNLADHICKEKLTTSDAVKWIKFHRSKQEPEIGRNKIDRIVKRIITAVLNAYNLTNEELNVIKERVVDTIYMGSDSR